MAQKMFPMLYYINPFPHKLFNVRWSQKGLVFENIQKFVFCFLVVANVSIFYPFFQFL